MEQQKFSNVSTYSKEAQLNLRLIIGLYRSYSRINRSTLRLLAKYNLTIAQFGVLESLYHLGPMRISDIIEKTLSTSGNMTVVIKNLEKDGWISRCTDPQDRRAFLVAITDKGTKLISTIFPEHIQDLDRLLGNLSEGEKKEFLALMKKLNGI